MNPEDRDIDRFLRGLGAADVPPQLEARILQRLAASTLAPHPSSIWDRRPWFIGGFAAACAVLLMVALTAHHPHPQPAATNLALSGHPNQEKPPSLRAPTPRTPHASAFVRVPAGAPSSSRAAKDTTATPLQSFPAPEAPLTQQERLLLKIARNADAPEVQILIPEKRELLLAQSRAEFDKYFPQPKPQEIYDEKQRLEP